MSFTSIPGGPPVPYSGDPLVPFDEAYEAFYTWEKDELAPGTNAAVAEMADLAEVVVLAAGEVADNAEAVAQAVVDAQAAAASAINAPGTNANSTTSLALTAGSKSWTIEVGKDFVVGMPIFLASASDATKRMTCILLTFNKATGACTGNMTPDPGATGTFADWVMGVGTSAASNVSLPRSARTSNTALNVGDKGKLIDITSGTFAQTNDAAGTLGADWFVWLANSGTGAPTWGGITLPQGAMLLLHSDGTTVRSYVLRMPEQVMVLRDEKASGVAPQTLTIATWDKRTLNTAPINTIPGASLTSDEFTLPAGAWLVSFNVPAQANALHKARLYNVTAGAVVAIGTTGRASASGHVSHSFLIGYPVVLAAPAAFRIDHYVGGTGFTGGAAMGIASTAEVYTEAMIRKVG